MGEIFVNIKVYLQNGETISYFREAIGEDYTIGSVSLLNWEFENITNVNDFINKLRSGKILWYTNDFVVIDDFIEDLKEQYGKDFEPKEDVEWYSYDCHKRTRMDTPLMVGASGYDTCLFWEEYHDNKERLESFISKIEKIDKNQILKIEAHEFNQDEYGEVYKDNTYTITLQ